MLDLYFDWSSFAIKLRLVAGWTGHISPLQSGLNCNLLTTETSHDLVDRHDNMIFSHWHNADEV